MEEIQGKYLIMTGSNKIYLNGEAVTDFPPRIKAGVFLSFAMMLAALLLLIGVMRTTYLSLINYDDSLIRIFSGRVFINGFQYPALPIKRWYILFTFFTLILLPYTVLARWLNHRTSRLAYWSFIMPTLCVHLYLLLILTLPFSWLIQYIVDMGMTPKRICGIFYGFGGYFLLLIFVYWAVRKPKAHPNPD